MSQQSRFFLQKSVLSLSKVSVLSAYVGQAEVISGQIHGNREKSFKIAATLTATLNYGIKKTVNSIHTILPKAAGHLPAHACEL